MQIKLVHIILLQKLVLCYIIAKLSASDAQMRFVNTIRIRKIHYQVSILLI